MVIFFFTGSCTCQPGYIGDTCDTVCDAGTYGIQCNMTCDCVGENTEACDPATGECKCKEGWHGYYL